MTEHTIADVAAEVIHTTAGPCPAEVLAILAGISDKAVLDAIVNAAKERKGELKAAPKSAKAVEIPATGTSTYAVVKGRTVFGVVIGSRAAAGTRWLRLRRGRAGARVLQDVRGAVRGGRGQRGAVM